MIEDEKHRIRAFLARFIAKAQIGDAEDLFALGFVNSLFAIQLVTFVEKEFGVRIESDDLRLDNFRSVQAIASLVARKTAAAEAS